MSAESDQTEEGSGPNRIDVARIAFVAACVAASWLRLGTRIASFDVIALTATLIGGFAKTATIKKYRLTSFGPATWSW